MRILIVCSENKGRINPFIEEQVDAIRSLGPELEYFTIKGKGITGYLSHYFLLRKKLRAKPYDLVHAHYGLSGLLCTFQKIRPVIITFHGSDVMNKKVRWLSRWAARRAQFNILVEAGFAKKLGISHFEVVPCGVNFSTFYEVNPVQARLLLKLSPTEPLVLFTSAFDNPVKNFPLAEKAIQQSVLQPRLIELKGYSREDVNLLMNACNVLLLTSFSEGSPQVVKEALTCRLPVLSTRVGDVPQLALKTSGITLVPYDATVIAETLDRIIPLGKRVEDQEFIQEYDNEKIASRICAIYQKVINHSV